MLPESINVKVSNGYAEFTKEFEIQYSTSSLTPTPTLVTKVELENLRLLTQDGLVEVTEDLSIVRSYFIVTTSDIGEERDVTLTYGDESTELHTLPYSHSVGDDRYYSCYWRPIKNLEQSLVT